jgi:hypothetical protein
MVLISLFSVALLSVAAPRPNHFRRQPAQRAEPIMTFSSIGLEKVRRFYRQTISMRTEFMLGAVSTTVAGVRVLQCNAALT